MCICYTDTVRPRELLTAFDRYLTDRGLRLEAVVIGGAALNLLWALCDRGLDLADCVALAPTADELAGILPWLEQQDANPDWPAHVRATLADVARRLGHAV
jgi:hypothetical protein